MSTPVYGVQAYTGKQIALSINKKQHHLRSALTKKFFIVLAAMQVAT